MGISQLGGTSYNRLVTKQNTGGITYAAVPLSVPNGSSSSWGQVISSTATEIAVLGVGFYTSSGGSSTNVAMAGYIDIAIGGAGAESILADVMTTSGNTTAASFPGASAVLPAPLRIGAGQRVALRATQLTSWGTTFALVTHITFVPWTSLEGN